MGTSTGFFACPTDILSVFIIVFSTKNALCCNLSIFSPLSGVLRPSVLDYRVSNKLPTKSQWWSYYDNKTHAVTDYDLNYDIVSHHQL